MKTWFRVVAILFVIFLGVGLLVALKSFSVPTVTTGEFILISGTNSLIIGGIILLSLTVLTSYRKGVSEEKATPEKIRGEFGEAFAQLIMDSSNPSLEAYRLKEAGRVADLLRKVAASEKNTKAYDALRGGGLNTALINVADNLRVGAEKTGDRYLREFTTDIKDGRADNKNLFRRIFQYLKDTPQSGLAKVIYSLLSPTPYGYRRR